MRAVQRLGLRYQVTLGVGLGLLVIVLVFGYLAITTMRQSTDVAVAERLRLNRAVADQVDAYLVMATDLLARAAPSLPGDGAASAVQRQIALKDVLDRLGIYDALLWVDNEGNLVSGYPFPPPALGLDPLEDTFAFQAMATGSARVGQVPGVGQPPLAVVAIPLGEERGGALLGWLPLSRDGGSLLPLPVEDPSLAVSVIDGRGAVVASNGRAATRPVRLGSGEPVMVDVHVTLLSPWIEAGESAVRTHPWKEGAIHLVTYVPLQGTRGGVILEDQKDVVLAVSEQLRQRLLLLGSLALVLAAVGAWLHARYVIRPIEQLEQATRHIAEGALERTVAVDRGDEIGMLAQSFEAMRLQLKQARDQRARWEEQLEAKVRERTEQVRHLLEMTISAQEEERRRLARELHDDTAQSIASVLVGMAALRDSLPPGQERVCEMVDRALAQGSRALAEMRRVIMDLRPSALDDLGFIPALRTYAEDRLGASGVKLEFQVRGQQRRLDPPVETAIFRILQEGVTNVVKHSRATSARITVSFVDGAMEASVEDNGRGFDPALVGQGSTEGGVGLEGMRERAELVGARLEIDSRPGAGTRVRVQLPVEETNG
ncbi:MAG: HAMP domain-containing protein [Chloroflexi bacterium]|nr:HAMP domain-containing protein [Chloroflexota bacterium]